jgi:hypothetical protein
MGEVPHDHDAMLQPQNPGAWIPKLLRRWTQIIWFARAGAAFCCVMFALYMVRERYWWAAVQVVSMIVNVANIWFCTRQRQLLRAYQYLLTNEAHR